MWAVLLLVLPIVRAQCIWTDPNSGATFNLTPLNGQTFTVNSKTYTYSYSPCRNGCVGPAPGNAAAQICQNNLGTQQSVAPVSIFDNTTQWSLIGESPTGGIQFTTKNGGPPNCPNNQPRAATVQLLCGPQGTLSMGPEPSTQQCSQLPGYTFSLSTPFACPSNNNGCPFLQASPCVISSYNIYWGAKNTETSILFNQQGNQCGRMNFVSSASSTPDTCATNSPPQVVAYWDPSTLDDVEALLQSGTPANPIVFFWDPQSQSAMIGQQQGAAGILKTMHNPKKF